jgi:hypothetical protein
MSEGNRFGKYASNWFKFENVSDSIAGTLEAVEEGIGTNGDEYPILVLTTGEGEETKVRASQYDLKEQLDKENPSDGDWLEIELVGFEQVAKGKMKRFRLSVSRNGESF